MKRKLTTVRSMVLGAVFALMMVALMPLEGRASGVNEDALIRGASEFLMERAEANQLYFFERTLFKDKKVRNYLPEIYRHVSTSGLSLWQTPQETWKELFLKDVNNSINRAIICAFKKYSRDLNTTDKLKQISENKGDFKITHRYFADEKNASKLIGQINSTWVNFENNVMGKYKNIKSCLDIPATVLNDLPKNLKNFIGDRNLSSVEKNMSYLENSVLSYKENKQPNDTIFSIFETKKLAPDESLKVLIDTSRGLKSIHSLADILNSPEKFTQESHLGKAIQIIDAMNILLPDDRSASRRFKRNFYFFAQLAAENNATKVKDILNYYANEPVSYGIKREKDETHWLITSYFGVGTMHMINHFEDKREKMDTRGLFVPVGIEYTWGHSPDYWISSTSIMAAPLDFGYPVTQIIDGSEEKFKFEQIVAPSLVGALGIHDYPVAIGAAFQFGKQLANGEAEQRAIVFISYDMPLWTLD